MALFLCNYENMLFGYDDYYMHLSEIIPLSKTLYIVDTDDWVMEKIKAEDLLKTWKADFDISNVIQYPDALGISEDSVDFSDYAIGRDTILGNSEYSISFSKDKIIITARRKNYSIVNKRYDYAGHPEGSKEFDESDWWYNSIIINNVHICDIMGGHDCEGTEFNISYAFKTKKYFIVRAVRLVDDDVVAVSFIFRGNKLVDVYASGVNADLFELKDFKPSDVLFQTKSKIKGEPY